MLRTEAVAGYFYPSDKTELENFFSSNLYGGEKTDACAVLVPHAGYIYSGGVAVKTLSMINIPETVILAGPNHTGSGASVSVYPEGGWKTPFGIAETDNEVIGLLCASGVFKRDEKAHRSEHSLEVMLPIIKYLRPDVKIVCITMKYTDFESIKTCAETLFGAVSGKKCLLLISSDFNHFENADITAKKDGLAIDSLIKMDEKLLYKRIFEYNISMCGFVPACMGLIYCKMCGVCDSLLTEHTHSGAVSGDNSRVVGYAGIIYRYKDK